MKAWQNLHGRIITRGPSINYSRDNFGISDTSKNYFVGRRVICRRDQTDILISEGELSGTLEEAGASVENSGLKG